VRQAREDRDERAGGGYGAAAVDARKTTESRSAYAKLEDALSSRKQPRRKRRRCFGNTQGCGYRGLGRAYECRAPYRAQEKRCGDEQPRDICRVSKNSRVRSRCSSYMSTLPLPEEKPAFSNGRRYTYNSRRKNPPSSSLGLLSPTRPLL